MICLQLLCALCCAAVLVSTAATRAATIDADLSNDRALVCAQHLCSVSTSCCRKGTGHEGKEHEEEDDASLLQVKLSSEGVEQLQGLLPDELQSNASEHAALSSAEEMNASSEVKQREAMELERELLSLTQAAGLEAGRSETNLTAGSENLKRLLEATEGGAMLDVGRARTTSGAITGILIFLLLLCLCCSLVALTRTGKPRGDSERVRSQRLEDTAPGNYNRPRPSSAFPQGSPLLGSTMRAKASSRGSPGSASKQPIQGGGLADVLGDRPGTSVSRPATQMSTSASSSDGSLVMPSAPGMPLCPSLIIPDGTRLACVIQNDLRRTKQNLAFDVRSVVQRGGASLFRIHVNELKDQTPGVSVETLDGTEQLAFLSTEDLWKDSASSVSPGLRIYRPKGALYGTVQKNAFGDYQVLRGQTSLMTISGDFAQHKIEITAASGRSVAVTSQASPEDYMVNVQSRVDAGLVVLALLAVDKCENIGR